MNLSYPTLLFSDVVSESVYALAMWVIAVRTPELRAHRWFTWAIMLALLRNVLLGTVGHLPLTFSILVPSLCNDWSFYCVYIGFCWAVMSRVPRIRFWRNALTALSVVFSLMFLLRVRYSFLLGVLPVFAFPVLSIRVLLRNRKVDLRGAVLAGIAVLCAHLLVTAMRARYIVANYGTASGSGHGLSTQDPLWLTSMAATMFVAACFFVVYLWFYEVEINRLLRVQARTDARTGALNVRALNEEGERELAHSAQKMIPLSVLAVDLDNFKHLNDRYGHAAGDEVLRQIVMCMSGEVRSDDMVARTGGEEFVILLPETDSEEATRIAERIRHCIQHLAIAFESEVLRVTVSIGISSCLGPEDCWSLLLRRADSALYRAKGNGRNCVEISGEAGFVPG